MKHTIKIFHKENTKVNNTYTAHFSNVTDAYNEYLDCISVLRNTDRLTGTYFVCRYNGNDLMAIEEIKG